MIYAPFSAFSKSTGIRQYIFDKGDALVQHKWVVAVDYGRIEVEVEFTPLLPPHSVVVHHAEKGIVSHS
jgi:hypothetical protein